MIFNLILLNCYAIFLLNLATYTYARYENSGKAKFRLVRRDKEGNRMTYCLPGIASNPNVSFRFVDGLVPGGMTYVKYSKWGFDPKTIADQIVRDIKKNSYEPYLISISVGDQVARMVEDKIKDVSIISINPLTSDECLCFETQTVLRMKLPFVNFIIACLGWLGQIKFFDRENSTRQSLSLYYDMVNAMVKSRLEIGKDSTATKVLVLSRYDEILDNRSISNIFYNVKEENIAIVDTEHANTNNGSILYREKLEKLLPKIY